MARKEDEKTKVMRQRRWERYDRSVQDFRKQGPYFKLMLQRRGCHLPFYDFLDSYQDEFCRIAENARKQYPSLLGIHEVDETTYRKTDWPKLGYGSLQVLRLNDTLVPQGYGVRENKANMCGVATAFVDEQRQMRTAIMIRQTVKGFRMNHKEFKYVSKIAALLHEIGHIHDFENGINFRVQGEEITGDIIEAEAFANLYALEKMAERQLVQSYDLLIDALRKAVGKGGYIDEVARRVLERLPAHQLIRWQDVDCTSNLTKEELDSLGSKGLEALGVKLS